MRTINIDEHIERFENLKKLNGRRCKESPYDACPIIVKHCKHCIIQKAIDNNIARKNDFSGCIFKFETYDQVIVELQHIKTWTEVKNA